MTKHRSGNTGASWRVNQVVMPAAKIIEHLSAEGVSGERIRAFLEACETSTEHKRERVSQQKRVLQVLRTEFPPDGHPPIDLSLKQIQTCLEPKFKEQGWRRASTDTIARALNRRPRG